jgi:hypothetical protein
MGPSNGPTRVLILRAVRNRLGPGNKVARTLLTKQLRNNYQLKQHATLSDSARSCVGRSVKKTAVGRQGFPSHPIPIRAETVPTGPAWLHEIKHDGNGSGGEMYSEHLDCDCADVFSSVCMGLEGVVSKHRDRPYTSGP